MARAPSSSKLGAQASNVTFNLHSLGWEAFQNLCANVLREILGQNVTSYSSSNDGGQDGTFKGTWRKTANEAYFGSIVVQCKFSAIQDEHLSLSHLKDELKKAARLAADGHANTYLLMTNAKVTGSASLKISKEFERLSGLQHFDILGGEWLTRQILGSKKL
ncbi:MAG: restriction endonuclease [Verrucomicrobiota bacterium]